MDEPLTEHELDQVWRELKSAGDGVVKNGARALQQLRDERNEARIAHGKLLLSDIARMEAIAAEMRQRLTEE